MVKQIDKYWDKLFADPIPVATPRGPVSVQPKKTNIILEQFFRYLKRIGRRRSGNHELTKILKTMCAQTPLVKNLDNPQYMEIILNAEASLAERFAEIDSVEVRTAFAGALPIIARIEDPAAINKIPTHPDSKNTCTEPARLPPSRTPPPASLF